ncbi:hypothetical protein [Nostoc sp.]|uniref:hypothetical protein n=1 Tax=Nostoc sp. TaxID=1180 RepID=UPI002FFC2000
MTLLIWTLSPFFNTASAKAYPNPVEHQTTRRPNALCQVGNCLAKCKHLARATPISSAIKSRYTIYLVQRFIKQCC